MRRNWLLFTDRLAIPPVERHFVLGLIVLLMVVSVVPALIPEPESPYDAEYYAAFDKIFEERSKQLAAEDSALLARYYPQPEPKNKLAAASLQPTKRRKSRSKPKKSKAEQLAELAQNKININTAGEETLVKLPGIGATTARRIVAYRMEKGTFPSFEAIKNVKGIGDKKLDGLRAFIKLKD